MKNKVIYLLAFFCSIFITGQQKFLEIPKLTTEDLAKEKSTIDPDAAAEILYKSTHYLIETNGSMMIIVKERIKIYDKDKSSDYLDKIISLYEGENGDKEKVESIKAFTFNLENNKIVENKVDKDSRYKSAENKRYNEVKFTFPNVKNGSVLEYKYEVRSPFIYAIPREEIEYNIPVKYIEYIFDAPKQLGYNINYTGALNPQYRDVGPKDLYGAQYNTYRFGFENLKAFKDEKYTLNSNNYKTAIRAELNSTYFNGDYKLHSLTWNDIGKKLKEHDNFGYELKKTGAIKDILPNEYKEITLPEKKAATILKFVQDNYRWNGKNNVLTDEGLRNLVSTKVGNTAEINLLLTMLLREAGLDANPVVSTTISRGLLSIYSPSVAQLNYVMAGIDIVGKFYLLDATSKYSSLNLIPPRALNYSGFLITEKEAKQLNIVNTGKSHTYLNVDAKMNEDGTFEGKYQDKDTQLFAMLVEEKYQENKEEFLKEYKKEHSFEMTNVKPEALANNEFQVSSEFTSDTFVDAVGGKFIFNPLLFLYSKTHSFNQTEERKYPIEFISGYDRVKKVTITIPDSYKFETLPKSKKFKTDDDSISYAYIVTQEGNKITIETKTSIEDSIYPKEFYPAFTQIFDNITKLEGQLVTVVKK